MSHPLGDDRPIEYDVLKIACYLGLVRVLVEVYSDFGGAIMTHKMALHFAMLYVFVTPLLLLKSRIPISVIASGFTFILIGFLGLNWIVEGGLYGDGGYPMMMIFLLVTMVLKGWLMVSCVSLLFITQAVLLYFDQTQAEWLVDLRGVPSINNDKGVHFLLMSFIAMAATFYAKGKFEKERLILTKKGRNLKSKLMEIETQNRILLDQKSELEQVKELLEEKVQERSEQLDERNEALAEYWKVSASEISQPLRVTVRSINDIKMNFKDQHELVTMLSHSGQELLESIKNVVKELENETITKPADDQR